MRRIRHISIVMTAVILFGSACAAGDIDLDLALDEIGATDMSESDDPGIRAAGETWVEVLSAREAEDNHARALATLDPDAAHQAAVLRPNDPRYPMTEAVLLQANDRGGTAQSWMSFGSALDLIAAEQEQKAAQQGKPKPSPTELRRIYNERYLDAAEAAIRASTNGEVRDRIIKEYCAGINEKYVKAHTDEFPLEVAEYLAWEADRSLCPNASG